MRKSVMNMRIFCVALGLMTASTWAQVPVFKLWVTEVYEVNPDGSYTAKCGVNCPTQDLLPGIAQPGDLINIEVTVEGWDASTDSGICDSGGEVCSVSAQDCSESHCTGATSGQCTEDGNCVSPGTCRLDICQKSPLVGTYQFVMDSSTYSNGGAPGLAPAELACTDNTDCACAYTDIDGLGFLDCFDFQGINPAFCTCTGAQAACDGGVCGAGAVAYIDSSSVPNFMFFGNNFLPTIGLTTLDYEIGAFITTASPGGVPEQLSRCAVGNQICNVGADCPEGACRLVAASPYYVGTVLLEATGNSCGLFTIDLIQDLITNVPFATFLNDNNAAKLPAPIVETLTIDLGSAILCNDGDLCTTGDSFCGNNPEECAGTPVECVRPQVCELGNCVDPPEDCGFANVTSVTWADASPLAANAFDRPGDCAIDAREPHSVSDANAKNGWDRLVLQFDCNPIDIVLLQPNDFAVQTNPVELSPPSIPVGGIDINTLDRTVTINLNRSISPLFYTCISHIQSRNSWCGGYLPADASQDGLSSAGDINALINAINAVPGLELPAYATDMNRSNQTNGQDILRLIDLLNGAGDFDQWIARALPACPTAP